MKERLKNITSLVKSRIEIEDSYTDFQGDLNDDGLKALWQLVWDSEKENLNITAGSDGKIYQYNRYFKEEGPTPYSPYFEPVFPKHSRKQAQAVAQKFLENIMGKNEKAFLQEENTGQTILSKNYNFTGQIFLNGLKSDLTFNLSVSAEKLLIKSFNRSDTYTKLIPDIPDNSPSLTSEKAQAILKEKNLLKLEYVLIEQNNHSANKSKSQSAKHYKGVLRYLAETESNWIVDGKTGELLDTNQLYQDLKQSSMAMSAMKTGARMLDHNLTETELAGAEKLEGALSIEVLEAKVRALAKLKIDEEFDLNQFSYDLNKDSGELKAFLNFTKPSALAPNQFFRKNLTLDGKSGALIALSTFYPPLNQGKYPINISEEEAENLAKSFLEEIAGEKVPDKELYKRKSPAKPEHIAPVFFHRYVQKINGIPVPANTFHIEINGETGSVDNFNYNWQANVVFDQAEDLISMDRALEIYNEAQQINLQYQQLPAALDPGSPFYPILRSQGYINELRLLYRLDTRKPIKNIDAKSGEINPDQKNQERLTFEYSDIEGHFAAKQIKALGEFSIGWPGVRFFPDRLLNQKEMLIFLLSARTPLADLLDNEELLYSQAMQLGLLEKNGKDASAIVSKTQVVKSILNMAGYKKAAQLQGIFKVSFADKENIKLKDFGYIALAQGLKLIAEDENNKFNPEAKATRAILAQTYYNFLNRELI